MLFTTEENKVDEAALSFADLSDGDEVLLCEKHVDGCIRIVGRRVFKEFFTGRRREDFLLLDDPNTGSTKFHHASEVGMNPRVWWNGHGISKEDPQPKLFLASLDNEARWSQVA